MNSEHVVHLQRMANESWRGSPELAALIAAIVALSTQQPAAEAQPVGVENITDEEIAEWEAERGNGMISCVGEYTPDEFWRVLDELKRLRAARQPASDGGFTAADMMVARQEGRREAQRLADVDDVTDTVLTENQRTRLIEELVEDQIEGAERVSLYLWDILENGFKGYYNYTDQELLDAYVSSFDEDFLDLGSGDYQ